MEGNFRELAEGMTLQGGKYVIERVLGTGGFGITYYAKHTSLNQHYAIKEFFISGRCVRDTMRHTVALQGIEKDAFEHYRQKFVEEAQMLARFNHLNIVKVVDVFDENGTSYIVMNYIDGVTLDSVVKQHGRLDYELAVNYLGQIAEATDYVHQQHLLHRDIKPDNIMITSSNSAILIDFGSAREFIQDKTQHQTSILTKGYAPIEQYSSTSRKGAYTDIYALGAVFYFMLTGTVPMDAATRLTEEMPEPKTLNPEINEDANRTIMKAMQLKQENRHQTVGEFMQDLLGQRPSRIVDETGIMDGQSSSKIDGTNKIKQYKKYALTGCIILIVVSLLSWIPTLFNNSVEGNAPENSEIEIIPGYPMVWVEGGSFHRGRADVPKDEDNYAPIKDSVYVDGFYMGKYEVTQELWQEIMGTNPANNQSDKRLPIENVTYLEVKTFIQKLKERYQKNFMLPTEAEWEYAAKGGKNAERKVRISGSYEDAWFCDNSGTVTHIVGELTPNELGLCDMSGNVSEFCKDYYDENFYKKSDKVNPVNTTPSDEIVIRGGAYDDDIDDIAVDTRNSIDCKDKNDYVGLRIILKK